MAILQLPRLPLPQEGSVPAGPSSAQPATPANHTVAPSRATVEEAASQFESFFLYMLLKEMDKTVNRSSLFGDGMATRFYREMYYERIADALSESGSPLGVSDLLLTQLQGADALQPTGGSGLPGAPTALDLTLLQYTAH